MAITAFSGDYRWLSNFWIGRPILYHGVEYMTAEHLYQSHKAWYETDEQYIINAPTPREAKRRGQEIGLPTNWDDVKDRAMFNTVSAKFLDPELAQKLVDTGDEKLIEGNTWHDNYWGNCNCGAVMCIDSQNKLGEILELVRYNLFFPVTWNEIIGK